MSRAYACFDLDNNKREKSSSRGIFILLAKRIIEQNDVVFGARFDENWRVIRDYAVCSVHMIDMKRDNEGFEYPEINEEKCIICRKCISVCPVKNQQNKRN